MDTYGLMGSPVPVYRCARATETPTIDGKLDDPCWAAASYTQPFRDMVTGSPAPLDTTAALLWDDRALYIGFRVVEPDLQASLTERDSYIWLEKDVEVFLAGPDSYYELEINALGTVYEALYVWKDAYTKGSAFARDPQFDLIERHVDILGGFQDSFDHPRGVRWVFRDWDFPGLRTAVALDGTLNDSTDTDSGWTVEIALPWSGMAALSGGVVKTPAPGDRWRINLFRFQTIEHNGRKIEPSAGWAWAPHGVYDSHIPECFAEIELAGENSVDKPYRRITRSRDG